MDPSPSRRRRRARPQEVAQRPAGGPKKEFSLRRQLGKSINLAYLDMATRTTREITLPPEIVALVFSFKPEADHWESAHRYPPIYFICRSQGRLETTLFHSCCGTVGYKITDVCTQIANGMYHPGRLEVTILPRSTYPYGTTKSLQWSCCGTKIFTQSAIGRTPHYRAPGCTPFDLTLRVTTVTRAAPPARSTEPESGQAA